MLTRLRRKLCWGHLYIFFIWGCLLLFLTCLLKYMSLECDLGDVIRDSGDLQKSYCKDQYYMTLKLPANGQKNCSKIIRGNLDEIKKTLLDNLIVKNKKVDVTDVEYLNITKDCNVFKERRKYVMFSLNKEEQDFPIAYSMVIHDNIEMFERLLRAIYAPQNVYCVHVDKKSPESFKEAARAITSCFDNVFVASKLEKVIYASWSRVQADLNCMEDLLQSEVQWRYLLNTCGTDFPIKTNSEIVKALKSLNGKNSMESEKPPAYKRIRWEYHYQWNESIIRTNIKKGPPPLNIPIFSGSAYIVVSRDFVKSLFVNPMGKQLIEWAKDTYSPDEYIWATLQRVHGIPGYMPKNYKYDSSDIHAIARLVKWQSLEGDMREGAPYTSCTGTHRREVCVYGMGDLHWMLKQHHLFANKFDPKVDDHAIQCLEEYLRYKSFHGKVM
ncbi:hypothetical protein FKM82_021247 [Ascaphus truei]